MKSQQESITVNRRRFIAYFSSIGLGSTLLPGTLTAVAQEKDEITVEMIAAAEKLAGLTFSDDYRKKFVRDLARLRNNYLEISEMDFDQDVPPCIIFNPVPPGMSVPEVNRIPVELAVNPVKIPDSDEELAHLPVSSLARLLKNREITSTELTKLYLSRLQKYNAVLNCVVTLTEETALRQAKKADEEISAGEYRGPLHGIPYGLKDIIAVKGYRTTYGAETFMDQVIDTDATVYARLRDAGAVLLAKLSTTALAGGNSYWFKGETKNPWDTSQGTTGSSGGSAAAVSAGLAAFAIGTETMGSIINPSARCGLTGLRPTFGMVSRHGIMPLSWTMDKVGPMCRTAADCALVFNEIYGRDGMDMSVTERSFSWSDREEIKGPKIGYLKSAFESDISGSSEESRNRNRSQRDLDLETLETFREMGVQLIPLDIPEEVNQRNLVIMRHVEGAAMFDKVVRDGTIDRTTNSNRPRLFRLRRLSPGVEYIQESRARTVIMQKYNEAVKHVDLYIAPHNSAMLTNQTGHPAMTCVNGFIDGKPGAVNFIGSLFKESALLTAVHAYQKKTGFHNRYPVL